jgi:hypothetical protein
MGIRIREDSCNIRRIGRGAAGRTTRETEKAEFGLIQFEEKKRVRSLGEKVKIRTLKSEGCGTPVVPTD